MYNINKDKSGHEDEKDVRWTNEEDFFSLVDKL